MTVELISDGYYLAYGKGCQRLILAEGGTRKEAVYNWTCCNQEQQKEQENVIYGDFAGDRGL